MRGGTAALVGGTFLLVVLVLLRLSALRAELFARWRGSLDGGAVTTRITVDEWFSDRRGDLEDLAASIVRHEGVLASGAPGSSPYAELLAPVTHRGRFTGVRLVDSLARPVDGEAGELSRPEIDAVRRALATGRTVRAEIDLTPSGAILSIVTPLPRRAPVRGLSSAAPAAVVGRTDVVASFSPWVKGRPNAAMSEFVTPDGAGAVLIAGCPEAAVPVCITREQRLDPRSAAALALAHRDTFGLFTERGGRRVLAATRYDSLLGWGVVRRTRMSDAFAPFWREVALEAAFLASLLVIAALAVVAQRRAARVRRLRERAQHQAWLGTIVNASTDGLVSLDERFTITMVNPAIERLFGHPAHALMGRPLKALFAPEWHDTLEQRLRQFARGRVARAPLAEGERALAQRSDGQLLAIEASIGRAELEGHPCYTVGVHDVSERARTEQFLHGQRHVLELMAAGSPVRESLDALLAVVESEASAMRCVVFEVEDDLVARVVSAPGLPPGMTELLDEVLIGPQSAAVGTAIHRGEPVYTTDIDTDDLWRDSRAYVRAFGFSAGWAMPLRASDGQVIGALGCFYREARGPTLRELELASAAVHLASIALASAHDAAQLRRSEASFRSFVENAPAAIFRETRHGRLISSNPAMCALLGYPDGERLAEAAALGELYHDPRSRAELLRTLEAHDVVRGLELDWRRIDGTRVRVRVSARAYRGDHGEVWLWEGFAEDVTALRTAEEALRRSEKLAAVGQLVSGVAHELNNPLSSIMHFAEDLLGDERSEEDREALAVIRDQARRSRAIVRDLLSFVRQREVAVETVRLSEVVRSTLRVLRPTAELAGARLEVEPLAEEAHVLADRGGLEQVVTNLVANAVHAAGAGGRVTVRLTANATTCMLEVADDGPGIPANVLPRIFDPFFTTKPTGEGTGLGLSVTLGIVEQMGGRITVEPRGAGEHGTRFVVQLPRSESVSTGATGAAGHPDMARGGPAAAGAPGAAHGVIRGPADAAAGPPRALVIDDEPSIRAALRRYFARRGWGVEEAADGAAGLELLLREGDQFHVVISDLRMPGLSGVELHDRIAADAPALLSRIVFSTGDVASEDAALFVQRTRCPVLQKPFELRMLDQILQEMTARDVPERVIA